MRAPRRHAERVGLRGEGSLLQGGRMIYLRPALIVGITAMVLAVATFGFAIDAEAEGRSPCDESPPGAYISVVAKTIGHSGEVNPGNAHNDLPPFVPFINGCNPTAK